MNDELIERQNVEKLGFWIYVMSDIMLFGALFATFMVLRHSTAGGPSGRELFNPSTVLIQTIALLASSLTAALALSAKKFGLVRLMKVQLVITAILGLVFLGMELHEFFQLAADGHSWQASAFLSSFFALVGTHGLHISVGLLWLGVLLTLLFRRGLTASIGRKLELFVIFWHFLDIVWIGIFTIVYMFGVGVS